MQDMSAIKVVSAPLPFSNLQTTAQALPNTSILEIVNNTVPEKYHGAPIAVIVMVNGQVIPKKYWKSVKPKANTIVNLNVVPQGGGGKKNPLASILSIAVLIAAPYAAGAILGNGIIASTALGAKLITGGLTAAIGAIGKLAISALAPPPKQSSASSVQNPTESPTQFILITINMLGNYSHMDMAKTS